MKRAAFAAALVAGALLLAAPAAAVQLTRRDADAAVAPGTIKQVVNLLKDLLAASQQEGKDERTLYAEYKCYCDDNEKEKKQAIEDATTQIGLLESEVAGLQAKNSELSVKCAQLKKDMDANVQARDTAQSLRDSEAEAFAATETDLTGAIDQLSAAIGALAAIGADMSSASAAHTEFMADYKAKTGQANFLKLHDSVRHALVAAGAFLEPSQRQTIEAFLQLKQPIGGAFVSQAGGVVGILNSMKETFETNLATARDTEQKAITAHGLFMEAKEAEHSELEGRYNAKQGSLGTNDEDLGTKKPLLANLIQQKVDDEQFLESLQDMCGKKAKEYDERVQLRATEEAAITKAIAILDSDHAFQAFGKVAATSTGATGPAAAFVQVSSIRRQAKEAMARRTAARNLLYKFAVGHKSSHLAQIAGLLTLGNPFTKVLEEIEKMKTVLEEEGKQDLKQKNWCESERAIFGEPDGHLKTKKDEIDTLDGEISQLETDIDHPDTGLKTVIAGYEETLETNSKAQKDETKTRREENTVYQETIGNCVRAEALLQKAIKVLKDHYKKEEEDELAALNGGASLVQRRTREEPAPPETWAEGEFQGQSDGGNGAIGMLEFIMSETQKEEASAHQAETEAQHAYEDSMTDLKDEETTTLSDLASAKQELADKLLELQEKRTDLEKTTAEKIAIERYLEKIKPGCDWIIANIGDRDAFRAAETSALEKAVELLQGTPAYSAAVAKEEELKQGGCADRCKEYGTDHVECKACMAKVSIPGYCAGHPSTAGCATR